ncbi:MAG TPA: murein biosynthesis integral membrane protein MurJ [Acidimicrobiales bacterium]|nr:murein biosynthesis integral membrane protein MurJ [Acidimicrobiales bacterium]
MTAPEESPQLAASRRAGASLRTGAGTIASRVTGLLRLVAVVYALGGSKSNSANAYNLANNTPNIVHDLVLGGILTASFVPVFVDRLAHRPRREAERSISAVFSMSVLVLAVSTVLLVVLAPAIIDLYSLGTPTTSGNAQQRALAVEFLRYFAPQVLAYGLISLLGAVLATRDRFVAVGIVPVVNNVVGIAILLLFSRMASAVEVTSGRLSGAHVAMLGIGTTAGVVLQAAALLPSLARSGARLRLIWRPHDPALGAIWRLSGWTLGFVAANQLAVFVVQALEYHLNKVADYSYAYQFFLFPYAVVAVSIVNVATPALARAHAAGDRVALGRTFGSAGRQVLALILPAAIGYLVLAKPLIALVLDHGRFVAADAVQTASTLALFALGLPAFCIWVLAIRTFQAMQDTRTAFWCYVLENGANIALAFAFYRPLGVKGLALAYALAYTVGAGVALAVLRRRLGTIGGRATALSCLRAVVLSLLMALAVAFTSAVLGSGSGLLGWLRLLVSVTVGGLVYLGGAGVAASMAGWQTSRRPRR